MTDGNCVGWWQQRGLGRQPMRALSLTFQDQRIAGTGVDIIAPFTLRGSLRADGAVEILKQYEQRHSVLYVGTYDGEGTMHGKWSVGGCEGAWSIRLVRPASNHDSAIQEI